MMHVDLERLAEVEQRGLYGGGHAPYEETGYLALCVMEAVAYVVGLPHSDHPECADPDITNMMIRMNDAGGPIMRRKLIPLIVKLAGSRLDNEILVRLRAAEIFARLDDITPHPDLSLSRYETEIWDREQQDRMLGLSTKVDTHPVITMILSGGTDHDTNSPVYQYYAGKVIEIMSDTLDNPLFQNDLTPVESDIDVITLPTAPYATADETATRSKTVKISP